jgi:hypothetical protein
MKILKSYCNIYSLNGAKGISIIDYIVYPVHPARYNYIVLLCNRAPGFILFHLKMHCR